MFKSEAKRRFQDLHNYHKKFTFFYEDPLTEEGIKKFINILNLISEELIRAKYCDEEWIKNFTVFSTRYQIWGDSGLGKWDHQPLDCEACQSLFLLDKHNLRNELYYGSSFGRDPVKGTNCVVFDDYRTMFIVYPKYFVNLPPANPIIEVFGDQYEKAVDDAVFILAIVRGIRGSNEDGNSYNKLRELLKGLGYGINDIDNGINVLNLFTAFKNSFQLRLAEKSDNKFRLTLDEKRIVKRSPLDFFCNPELSVYLNEFESVIKKFKNKEITILDADCGGGDYVIVVICKDSKNKEKIVFVSWYMGRQSISYKKLKSILDNCHNVKLIEVGKEIVEEKVLKLSVLKKGRNHERERLELAVRKPK